MITRRNGRVRLETPEDGVAYIAALVVQTIAAADVPGHDLETVARRVLTDRTLDTIRTAYTDQVEAGSHPKEAIKEVGVATIRAYRRAHWH
jgi:hypothetical protein